jgi:uncharacterized protein (DUF58 family)
VLRPGLPTPTKSPEGQASDVAPQGGLTFHALREYVAGDDLRHVHWPSSARLGQLVVREFVDLSLPDVTVVLDVARTAYDDEHFEVAVEVAASVLTSWSAGSFPARLLTTTGADLSSGGGRLGSAFLDRLAAVEPVDDAGFVHVQHVVRARDRGFGLVVVTGTLDDESSRAIGLLARPFEHRVVVTCTPGDDVDHAASLAGATLIHAPTSAAFAASWNSQRRLR